MGNACSAKKLKINGHKGGPWSIWVVCFLVLSVFIFTLNQADFEFVAEHGLFVADSVNITQTFENLWETDRLFEFDSGFLGLAVIYGWTWQLNPSLCFVVNLFLLLVSVLLYKNIAYKRLKALA